MDRLPSMQALRALEAAERLGSLSDAARELFLTHGAVSHQLRALERDLGAVLVVREGRGMRATEEGARFAARVREVLAALAEAAGEVRSRHDPRRLRLSVMPSFAARWLLPRLGRFIEGHPEIDIDVNASALLVDFSRSDCDLAIRWGGGNYPGLACELMLHDVYFPVCAPDFNGGRLPRSPADLAGLLLLRSSDEYWRPWFEAAGIDLSEPTRGPKFDDSSLMLQAAIDGRGVALARRSLVGRELASGVLVRLFDVASVSPASYFLVHPRRLSGAPKIEAFRTWLRAEIRAESHPDKGPRESKRAARVPRRSATAGSGRAT